MHPTITPAMVARSRGIAEPRLSPDGTHVAYVATVNRRASLVVVPVGGGPEEVLTSDLVPRGAGGYGGGAFAWVPDGRSLVVASDGDLWLVDRTGGPGRRLTHHGGGAAAPAVAPHGHLVAYTVDLADVAVASLDEGGPWPVRVSRGGDFVADPAWWPDGQRVGWQAWDVPWMAWDDSRVVAASAAGTGDEVVVHHLPQTQSLQVQPSGVVGGPVALVTDVSGWANVSLVGDGGGAVPVVAEPYEHAAPTWVQGQRSFAWSPDARRMAYHRNESGFGRLCVTDVGSGVAQEVAKGWHEGLTWAGDRLAAVRSGARTPTQLVVYDTTTWERRVLVNGPVAGWDAVLAEPELVTWPGDDGGEVFGRLYRPPTGGAGADGELPPLIVWTHGGPTSQWPVSFLPRIAYQVARGWAVLLVDYRGSSGHGRAYALALRERWGELDVADAAAGARAAIEREWCHPRRLAAMGGSAGGFTTYGLLAQHPDLFAAGVSAYGVADLLHLDETSHRFERHYLHTIVGPLPEAADRYRERSPVVYADRITAPLLVLQGADDEVVPPAQSRAIVERLQALGRTVEYHEYEGEGHGWSKPETVIDELERTDDFLRRHVLRWRP